MAKKEKKVPVSKLTGTINKETATIPLDGAEGVDIVVQKTISLQEMMQFVVDVVASCVDEAAGTYRPEVLPFAIKAHVLESYTNLALPADAKKQYDLVYNTKVVEQVVEQIDPVQYYEILDAVSSRVAYATRKMGNLATEKVNELLVRMEAFADNAEQMFAGPGWRGPLCPDAEPGKVRWTGRREVVDAVFSAQKFTAESAEDRGDNVVELRKTEE